MRIDGRKNRTVRGSLLHAAYGPPFTAMIVLAALSQACAQPDASNAAPVRSPLRSSKIDPPEAPTRSLASDVNRVRVIAGTTSAGMKLDERGVVPTSRLVYSNTLERNIFGPTAGVRIADDIITTAAPGCLLDRYIFRVSGDKQGDSSGVGPYTVEYALYETCPGSSTAPTPIPGTAGTFQAPDNGVYDVEVVIPESTDVVIPNALYLALTFSRENAGVFLAGPALLGLSADRFDFPSDPCNVTLGGFPAAPHASFHAELYVRGTCGDAYPAYVNSNQGGRPFTPDATRLMAEDISLSVDPNRCNMVAYTVAFRGQSMSSIGTVRTQLHTILRDVDPETSGLIPGTIGQTSITGDGVQLLRAEFDTPILLTQQNYWMVIQTSNAQVGPIATCVSPALGETQDVLATYVEGEWSYPLDATGCGGGLEITIYCQGPPPTGACCDMIHTDNRTCIGGPFDGLVCISDGDCVCPPEFPTCLDGTCVGDSVCREGARMNCAFPELWQEDTVCESTCDGGDQDGQPCTRQADCPGGDCPGPFSFNGRKPCGTSACCTHDDFCLNITERECTFIEPVSKPREFESGQSCGLNGQRCDFGFCLGSEGSCCTEDIVLCVGGTRDGLQCTFNPCPFVGCDGGCKDGGGYCPIARGCSDASCCTKICREVDFFCCDIHWDYLCVAYALALCDRCGPLPDECHDPFGDDGPAWVEVPSSREYDLTRTTTAESDPGFCCFVGDPGAQGTNTAWFRFIAPQPTNPEDETVSVEISTCGSREARLSDDVIVPADDSLIQVFALSEPLRGVCDSLAVCNVSDQDCADGSMCVFDEQYACANLITIGCNDDGGASCVGPGGVPQPTNSTVCVANLIAGQTYYFMVAAKSEEHRGFYRITVDTPCPGDPPPVSNDLCEDAELVEGFQESIPFDLAGESTGASPATFECPAPTCAPDLDADIWYDWTAPIDARVTLAACPDESEGLLGQPMIVVYAGCDCPVDSADEVACGVPTAGCAFGTEIQFDAVAGACYKIRVGGRDGDTPAGYLSVLPSTCVGGTGDCCVEQASTCVGGEDDGQPCDPAANFLAPCFVGGGECPDSPGCGDPTCCGLVCGSVDPYCCDVHWDALCAATAIANCDCPPPPNDECSDLDPARGAKLLSIPSFN